MSFIDDWNKQAQTQVATSGVGHSWDDYFRQQEQQRILKELQDKNIKAAAPKGNFLTSLLPTGGGIGGALAGGAAGAALGSAVPVVGTAIGGLLGAILGGSAGSAAGKVGENAVEGESDLGKGVGQEALLGGVTSLPLGAGFKLARAGVKAATGLGGKAASTLAKEAGQQAIPKLATGLQAKAAADVTQSAAGTVTRPTNTLISTIKSAAANSDAKTSGLGVGQKINGKIVTPSQSADLLNFARTNGVKAGTPISQAKAAENLLKNSTNNLDTTLASIDRPLTSTESANIVKSISDKLASVKGVGKGANTDTNKFISHIGEAKSLSDLEALRKEADGLAFTANGAGKTVAAKQAQTVRDAIDSFITPLSPEYKAAKGAYTKAKNILNLTSTNAKSANGGLNVLGNKVGSQAIPGAISKGTNLLSGIRGEGVTKATGQGVLGTVARESLLGGRPDISNQGTQVPLDANGLTQEDVASLQGNPIFSQGAVNTLGTGPTPEASNPFGISLSDVASQLTQAIQKGDTKGYATLSDLYDKINSYETAQGKTAKPLSAEASKTVANATSGLESVASLENMIASGGVPKGTLIPGRSALGGALGNALGTSNYDTTARNIQDVITRLRSGAAITDQEASFYNSQLPQAFDSPETIATKIAVFKDLFGRVANQTGSAGTDIAALAGQ